ncbi:MAG: 3-hydroxyacyl-ACP dehydratase FabZ [Brevinemataceae bacterium]
MKEYFNIKDICKLLPHRFPMLLVDRILKVSEDGGTGYKNVTINEDFFNGHFPDVPVMPGVLQVEGLAQCAGFIALTQLKNRYPQLDTEGVLMFFMGIDGVKFRKPVVPGDRLEYRVQVTKRRESVSEDKKSFVRVINSFDTKAYVDDELVCECSMTAMLTPRDKGIV